MVVASRPGSSGSAGTSVCGRRAVGPQRFPQYRTAAPEPPEQFILGTKCWATTSLHTRYVISCATGLQASRKAAQAQHRNCGGVRD